MLLIPPNIHVQVLNIGKIMFKYLNCESASFILKLDVRISVDQLLKRLPIF